MKSREQIQEHLTRLEELQRQKSNSREVAAWLYGKVTVLKWVLRK